MKVTPILFRLISYVLAPFATMILLAYAVRCESIGCLGYLPVYGLAGAASPAILAVAFRKFDSQKHPLPYIVPLLALIPLVLLTAYAVLPFFLDSVLQDRTWHAATIGAAVIFFVILAVNFSTSISMNKVKKL